jgi:hypothetical protein
VSNIIPKAKVKHEPIIVRMPAVNGNFVHFLSGLPQDGQKTESWVVSWPQFKHFKSEPTTFLFSTFFVELSNHLSSYFSTQLLWHNKDK